MPDKSNLEKLAELTEALLDKDKRLEEKEEKYTSIFNSIGEAVLLCDLETLRVRECNGEASRLLEYTPEELSRLSLTGLLLDETQHVIRKILTNKDTNAAEIVDAFMVRKSGSKFYASIIFKEIYFGNKPYLLMSARNIEHRRRTNLMIETMNEFYLTLIKSIRATLEDDSLSAEDKVNKIKEMDNMNEETMAFALYERVKAKI